MENFKLLLQVADTAIISEKQRFEMFINDFYFVVNYINTQKPGMIQNPKLCKLL